MNRCAIVGSIGMGRRALRLLICSVAFFSLLLCHGGHGTLFCKTIARVGILPFQVYSGEKVAYLQEVIASGLAQQLEKTGLSTLDPQEITKVVEGKAGGGFNPKEISAIAHKTGSDFLVYGSLTKIDDNLSIDARVFNSSEGNALYKDYVEGKDLDRLIENLGTKISQRIAKVALNSLPSESITEEPKTVSAGLVKGSAERKPRPSSPESGPPLNVSSASPKGGEGEAKASSPISDSMGRGEEEADSVSSAPSTSTPSPPEAEEASSEANRTSSDKGKNLFSFDKKSSSPQPINITSDRMEADNRNRTVNFVGNVVAKREDMVIFSDRLSTFYAKDGKIDKIVAQGNVKINQNDRMATCLEATFFQPSQKIVLTGKPKVWQGSNIITGEIITLSLKEDKVDIEGSKQTRVNATIYPMGKTAK